METESTKKIGTSQLELEDEPIDDKIQMRRRWIKTFLICLCFTAFVSKYTVNWITYIFLRNIFNN